MIQIYGSPQSSSGRCFWCLEEVGVEYEAKPIDFRAKEHQSPEFLKLNPNGKVPLLEDNGFKVWESMAINFYLAEKYKPELLSKSAEESALIHQWSFWAIAELQPPLISMFIQKFFVPEERRDETVIKNSIEKFTPRLETLNNFLETNIFLCRDNFSLADLNTASVVSITKSMKFDMDRYTNINRWLAKIAERPAFRKYMALMED